MESTKLVRRGFLAALIALAVLSSAYVEARGGIGGQASASSHETDVLSSRAMEAAMGSTSLVERLEARMGDGFGGAWFEDSTAQLHVGVTSEASREAAEAVAAEVGLASNVTETPVRSTRAELGAAQDELSHRLADLFARGQVVTSIAPDENAVVVELASTVPAAEREALEDEAASADFNVSISTEPDPRLSYTKAVGQCRKFEPDKAFCDSEYVAGVSIESTNKEVCTGGPAVRLQDHSTKAKETLTYILTAGHCIDSEMGGGLGTDWFAFNKEGKAIEVGEAVEFLNAETDVGVIKVNSEVTPGWLSKGFTPLVPTVATWDTTSESNPFEVHGQKKPTKGTESCLSGQTSGTNCGEIVNESTEIEFEPKVITKNLVEVKMTKMEPGDSGGPWFSISTPTEAEGTAVGWRNSNNYALFHSLATSFSKLSTKLELLTKENKVRHPRVKAGKYPVTTHGGLSGGAEKFVIEGGAVECKKTSHHSVISEETSTWTDTPKFENCTMFGFEGATVNMEGCYFENHAVGRTSADNYKAEVDVVCPEGKSIKMAAGTCKAEIKGQTGLETMDLIDDTSASPKKDITLRPTVGGIAYTVTEDGCVCKFNGTGNKTGGEYLSTENITVTGQSTTTPSEKIDIEVAG